MSLIDEEDKTPGIDPAVDKQDDLAPDPADQLLKGIKNDRGEQKYSNVTEALNALKHAQEFIATLKREKEELSGKVKTQEELMEMLNSGKTKGDESVAVPAAKGLTPEEVIALINNQEKEKQATQNLNVVKGKLQEKFGAEYKEVLKAKIGELGLTPELVDNMAKTSPASVFKLLGVDGGDFARPKVSNAIRTPGIPDKAPEKPRFRPASTGNDPATEKWLKSKEKTNARLGLN